jgi:hypothetical protein
MKRMSIKKGVFKSYCVFLSTAAMLVISSAQPYASDRMVEFAFGGTVTNVVNLDQLPEEWQEVLPGDVWSMIYHFKSWIPMTFVEAFGLDAYDGAVTSYSFTIERDGVEILSASSAFVAASWIFILDNGEVDPGPPPVVVDRYSVQIRDPRVWDQGFWLTLQDSTASAWDSRALPLDGDVTRNVALGDYDSAAMQFGAGSFPTQPEDGGFQGSVSWHTSTVVSPSAEGGCFIATAAGDSSTAYTPHVHNNKCKYK